MIPGNECRIEGEVVLPCRELDDTLAFFCDRLGFRVLAVFPADGPTVAVLTGGGLRVRLDATADGDPGALRLLAEDPDAVADGERELVAPNGTRVLVVDADPPVTVPPLRPSLSITHLGDGGDWATGRAGMRYRDLVPDRQGGRFIASHIHIPQGGPVPDYPHYHKVRFQMIYCYRGWVRVAYEDQGPPFLLEAGDCVLQPPRIRHRVLESSRDLEVVELGCPAAHETLADHDCVLPTGQVCPDREFDGQTFVRHVSKEAAWSVVGDGFEGRDTGIAAATKGLASVVVLRATGPGSTSVHDGELHFTFVLEGSVVLECEGADGAPLGPGDACVVPAGRPFAFTQRSSDLQLLRVTVPGA